MWFLAVNHLSASMESKFYEKRSLVIFCGQKNPPFKLIGMLGVIWIEFFLFSEISIWKPILNSQVPNTLSCPNCMFLLKKLPPKKKMTASCHPALFESEKSWLLHPGECEKGRKIVKVGNPGLCWSRNLPTGKSREMVVNICENPIGSDDTCQIVSKCFSARPRLGGTRKVRLQWFDPIDQS